MGGMLDHRGANFVAEAVIVLGSGGILFTIWGGVKKLSEGVLDQFLTHENVDEDLNAKFVDFS